MALKIEMLRTFGQVVQSGTLADAAAHLGRTPSAVSMALKALEDHLGARLFEGERKTRLTPLGEHVFTLAQQQVHAFDATVREIEATARAPRGLLRIASIPSVAGRLVPEATARLLSRHPGIKIEIRDTDTAQVIEGLVRGQADIGLLSGVHTLNEVTAMPLFTDAFGLTAAPSHPLMQADEVTLDRVLGPGFLGNNLCLAIARPDIAEAVETAAIHAHNTFSLVGLLATGDWQTILPRRVVDDLPGTLAFRPISDLVARRTVSAMVASRSSQRRLAEEFVSLLQTPAGD